MKIYRFVVVGNQESLNGNPIPCPRETYKSSRFNKQSQRYHRWRDYVRNAVNTQTDLNITQYNRLKAVPKTFLCLRILFKNRAHADPDNIFKGVADALFENDKYLSGCFSFDYADSPRIECILVFP